MIFKRLSGFLILLPYVDGQVDGELSAATLYGSIRHRPQ